MQRFEGKTVAITGAASGIGAAAAKRFANEGANVVLADAEGADLQSQVDQLPEGKAVHVTGDLAHDAASRAMVEAAMQNFGGIDILIANAGIAVTGTMGSLPVDDFDGQLKNNIGATYLAMKSAWAPLTKAKGCVIATSSVSGERADWNAFAYNTSKAAISNLVRACALDYRTHGLRVNAVAPGFTHTGLTAPMEDQEAFKDAMYDRIPMGRGGEPEEIASVMAFLASDDASFVNGAVIPVDGGLMASNGQPPLPG
ncbi:SDR family NAD(P)-dependent oxidoreductase [Palleronia abyssalis]|uniref:Dihydroanticapsin 7-dehydrogenase n=1 Tax=Palleronia abyssalis TaxID=1501240 RepID=A0A2R8BW24_9RHOB|nr:SDR family oxidoreductase [Palleronia abyssalis]SPJ24364.1 Dihydroanticapsin 7-dehydrogenase [Palleronia abyssalis]